jgi:Carboxypeptidase regulatory-like domain
MRAKYIASLTLTVLASSVMGAAMPDQKAGGTISGTVTFTGTPPKMRAIDMAKEPSCAAQHPTPVMTENVVTGPGNTVANVVVYVSAGDPGSPAPSEPVRYDQKGCEYVPHVAVLQVGQPLEIYNDDQTSHNIHPLATVNPEWNKSQPPGTPPLKASYAKPEFIAVKCNVHPWMHGYFAVLTTSHHSVSGSDGTFSLKDLPPGKYTITAWHEKFGRLTQDVTITGAETATANFVFKALPY